MAQEYIRVAQFDHSQVNPLRMLPNGQSCIHVLGDLSTLVDCSIGIVNSYGYEGFVCGKPMSPDESQVNA